MKIEVFATKNNLKWKFIPEIIEIIYQYLADRLEMTINVVAGPTLTVTKGRVDHAW